MVPHAARERLENLFKGDSDAINVGHFVIAIGNPFRLEHTVTFGIVSAKGRANVGIAAYEDFIQTSAAINPGNSGGPLVTLDGEVIGIATAIVSRTGGFQGIGFAIPSNMVKTVMKALIEEGKVTRGWLGVYIQDLTPEMAQGFGLEESKGVLISDVLPDQPAGKAGIMADDIILAFNGKEVSDVNELRNVVAQTSPGAEADVTVIRDGEERTFVVTVTEKLATAELGIVRSNAVEKLGLKLRDITPDDMTKLGLENNEGALVEAVRPNSVAARAGIRPGAVIQKVVDIDRNRKKVRNSADFAALIGEIPEDKNVLLYVQYRDSRRWVLLKRR